MFYATLQEIAWADYNSYFKGKGDSMHESLQAHFALLRRDLRTTSVSEEAQRRIAVEIEAIPRFYAGFQETYQHRFIEQIGRAVNAILYQLESQADIHEAFRTGLEELHGNIGLPALKLTPLGFTREQFVSERKFLYHFTNPENFGMLQRERAMLSASAWVERANAFMSQIDDPGRYLGIAREEPRRLQVGPCTFVTLNDQKPLLALGQMPKLQGSYKDFLRCLNSYVFYWPGDEKGPKPPRGLAKSFGTRYAHYGLLRVPTAEAWRREAIIQFCRNNSGAPQARDRIERGPQMFFKHNTKGLEPKEIAEVVFSGFVDLPPDAEWKDPGSKTWRPLFSS
jgi:hypothetical protein